MVKFDGIEGLMEQMKSDEEFALQWGNMLKRLIRHPFMRRL